MKVLSQRVISAGLHWNGYYEFVKSSFKFAVDCKYRRKCNTEILSLLKQTQDPHLTIKSILTSKDSALPAAGHITLWQRAARAAGTIKSSGLGPWFFDNNGDIHFYTNLPINLKSQVVINPQTKTDLGSAPNGSISPSGAPRWQNDKMLKAQRTNPLSPRTNEYGSLNLAMAFKRRRYPSSGSTMWVPDKPHAS
jgi:hypothetical protein